MYESCYATLMLKIVKILTKVQDRHVRKMTWWHLVLRTSRPVQRCLFNLLAVAHFALLWHKDLNNYKVYTRVKREEKTNLASWYIFSLLLVFSTSTIKLGVLLFYVFVAYKYCILAYLHTSILAHFYTSKLSYMHTWILAYLHACKLVFLQLLNIDR